MSARRNLHLGPDPATYGAGVLGAAPDDGSVGPTSDLHSFFSLRSIKMATEIPTETMPANIKNEPTIFHMIPCCVISI